MDIQHPDAEISRRSHGAGHRIGNVMELQVEEHAVAALDERPDDSGPAAVKSWLPILYPPNETSERVGQRDSFGG